VTVRKKDFAAKEVNVTFRTTSGEVIERGKATIDSNGAWVYRNLAATGERVIVVEIEAVNWDGCVEKKTSTWEVVGGTR
jgi:hypothetical protein